MKLKNPFSFSAAALVSLMLVLAVTAYYPKYKNTRTEATISWDVCGYYYYLPAFFIYNDARQLAFTDTVMKRYGPSGSFDMAMLDESGNYVMKYSSGQAIMYLPSFAVGHVFAKLFGYPADGFSLPYQMAISFGSLLFCVIGFWLCRKILLKRFSDRATAVTLLCIGIGTNYFEYASMTAQMTHGYLFTLYCVLILLTQRFYERPTYANAGTIGLVIGFCALMRPTEIISVLVPLLWGLDFPLKLAIRSRLIFIRTHATKALVAIVCCAAIGSIQLMYWRYATGRWLVYSYGEQSFSWLKPHVISGMWSYNNGWLVYSPMMYYALFGLAVLWFRKSNVAAVCLVFTAAYIYMAFAWDIWWYGGSLGQRTMVQAYPVMSIAFAAFAERMLKTRWWKYVVGIVALFFVYYNLWLVHQAHHGGKYKTGETTRAYFWKTFLTYKSDPEELKLLDTNEWFDGERANVQVVYTNDFESDTNGTCSHQAVQGTRSVCLPATEASREYGIELKETSGEWMRVNVTFRCSPKEWDTWQMPQLIVRYYDGDEKIKEKMIRAYRTMNENEIKEVFIDSRIPSDATRITVSVWNASQSKPTQFDSLRFESFDER